MRLGSLVLASSFCIAALAYADDNEVLTDDSAPPTASLSAIESENPPATETHAKQPIQFDGETFQFAWEGSNPTTSIKEFIPAGQTLDTWTKFVALNEYPHLNDPRTFAEGIVKELEKQNPKFSSQMQVNDKTGEVILDFVNWPQDMSFVEFDLFKFHKREGGGVVGEQYSQRAYTHEEQQALLDGLGDLKKRVLPQMAEHGLQAASQPGESSPAKPE